MNKSCNSYPFSQNCVYHDINNKDLKYFKQFNPTTQSFNCCFDVDVSPSELKNYMNTVGKTGIIDGVVLYLEEINNYKNANGNTGCDYEKYTDLKFNTNPNHEQLYNNLLVDNMIYNNFFVDNNPPSFDKDYSVSCAKTSEVPYILDYKGINENSIYNKTLYVCNETKGSLFPSLRIDGELLDYKISYFYTNNNNPVTTNEKFNLRYKSASNPGTRGNKSAFSVNKKNTLNGAYLGGGVFLIVFSLFCMWLIYNEERKIILNLEKM